MVSRLAGAAEVSCKIQNRVQTPRQEQSISPANMGMLDHVVRPRDHASRHNQGSMFLGAMKDKIVKSASLFPNDTRYADSIRLYI
jgi:hypothetical protein